jgi:hypothetical protein
MDEARDIVRKTLRDHGLRLGSVPAAAVAQIVTERSQGTE